MTLFQSQRHDMSQTIATKSDIAIISQDSLSLAPFRMYICFEWPYLRGKYTLGFHNVAAFRGFPCKEMYGRYTEKK